MFILLATAVEFDSRDVEITVEYHVHINVYTINIIWVYRVQTQLFYAVPTSTVKKIGPNIYQV
jgi:hypothetical protein